MGGYSGGHYGGLGAGSQGSGSLGNGGLGGSHYSGGYQGLSSGSLGHSLGTGGLNQAGGLNHVGGLNHAGGLNHSGGLNHTGTLGQHTPSFVNNYAGGAHTVNHSGNFNGQMNNGFGHHNHSYWNNRSFFFGGGSPFGGYLGYPWWGFGYGNRFGYFPFFGYGYGLYGLGYGYGGYYGLGYGYPYSFGYQSVYPYYGGGMPAATVAMQDPNNPPVDQLQNSLDYAGQGEIDFKQGKYTAAIQSWRHALVDDPTNGAVVLLLSQALFAAGQWDEAAGATQAALRLLPPDKWGTVVVHYKELYPNIQDYTNQIRAAEKARDAKPEDPALHFLLGYHFGYLGFPKQAVKELEKTIELAPKDELARKLRDDFAAKLEGDKPVPAPPKPEPPPPADGSTET